MKVQAHAKAIVAVVITVLTAIVAFATDGNVDNVEWVNTAIAGVGAVAVYYGPNTRYAKYTKGILAALTAVLVLLASLITDGLANTELIQLLIVAAGAVGVYAVPNKGYHHDDTLDTVANQGFPPAGPVGGSSVAV